jgi:hypothetical protein
MPSEKTDVNYKELVDRAIQRIKGYLEDCKIEDIEDEDDLGEIIRYVVELVMESWFWFNGLHYEANTIKCFPCVDEEAKQIYYDNIRNVDGWNEEDGYGRSGKREKTLNFKAEAIRFSLENKMWELYRKGGFGKFSFQEVA